MSTVTTPELPRYNKNSPDTGAPCNPDTLNSLLRGEMAAIETYEQASTKFEDPLIRAEILRFRDEHQEAVRQLRQHVVASGAEPSQGSGWWGLFAEMVTGTAKVIGPISVLDALRQGEEYGISDYERALEDNKAEGDCRSLIQSELLTRCREHVSAIDRIIETIKHK